MKIILTLIMCSYTSQSCLPPLVWHENFIDMYECMNAGYSESLKKAEKIGREEINKHGIYIRFTCTEEIKKEKTIT